MKRVLSVFIVVILVLCVMSSNYSLNAVATNFNMAADNVITLENCSVERQVERKTTNNIVENNVFNVLRDSEIFTSTYIGNTDQINWRVVIGIIIIVCNACFTLGILIFLAINIIKQNKAKKLYVAKLRSEIKSLKDELEILKNSREELVKENSNLCEELKCTKQTLSVLQDREKLVAIACPDVDEKINEVLHLQRAEEYKKTAKKVDDLIYSVITLEPGIELVENLQWIKQQIDTLTANEVRYLEADLTKFNKLYDESLTLKIAYDEEEERKRIEKLGNEYKQKADEITRQLFQIISEIQIAAPGHLDKLGAAKALYTDVDDQTRSYISQIAIARIEARLKRAIELAPKRLLKKYRRKYNYDM